MISVKKNAKTISDQLFETYLRLHGLRDFVYEPKIDGTTRSPDYQVEVAGSKAYFEVKEFAPDEPLTGGSFAPYAPVRSKIHDAQKQLRSLKGRMCAIVLSNPHNAFVLLNGTIIYGDWTAGRRRGRR